MISIKQLRLVLIVFQVMGGSASSKVSLANPAMSVVNQMAAGKDTVYYNSPETPKADIVHSLVPERQVADAIFQLPQTKQNVRDANDHVRTAEKRNPLPARDDKNISPSPPDPTTNSSPDSSSSDEDEQSSAQPLLPQRTGWIEYFPCCCKRKL